MRKVEWLTNFQENKARTDNSLYSYTTNSSPELRTRMENKACEEAVINLRQSSLRLPLRWYSYLSKLVCNYKSSTTSFIGDIVVFSTYGGGHLSVTASVSAMTFYPVCIKGTQKIWNLKEVQKIAISIKSATGAYAIIGIDKKLQPPSDHAIISISDEDAKTIIANNSVTDQAPHPTQARLSHFPRSCFRLETAIATLYVLGPYHSTEKSGKPLLYVLVWRHIRGMVQRAR